MRSADVFAALGALCFAALGTLARMFNLKNYKAIKMRRVIGELMTAVFLGSMVFVLSRMQGWEAYWACFIAGFLGWGGPKAIDWLWSKAGISADKGEK